MKILSTYLVVTFACIVAANAEDYDSLKAKFNKTHALTLEEWKIVITKDAKFSSVQTFIGVKPDDIKEIKIGGTVNGVKTQYEFYSLVDVGTKFNRSLYLGCASYAGQLIVCSTLEPRSQESFIFPWAQKILDAIPMER